MAPLPPLPDNNTARLWIDYTSLGRPHSALVRIFETAGAINAGAVANRVIPVIVTRMLQTDSVTGARFAEAGENFSVPLAITPTPGVVSGANVTWENDPESAFLTLPGRDSFQGRKTRFGLFSPVRTVSWPGDNRYNPGDEPVIDTFRINLTAALNNSTGPDDTVVTIGNNPVRWAGYVNISHNAYWQRKQRRGG